MTRSSTNELFTPYKEPEREFRSSRKHFKSLSLDELRSPDFNLLSDQEYSEEEEAETMAKTMEQYMSKTRTDYGSGVARHKIDNKDQFELKGQFLKELQIKEVILFYNGLDVPTRQILDSRGVVPTKTAADAKTAIQEMAEYSQKWRNGTSRGRSIETSDGLAAIQAQLNNLGREIKKVNEKVYAAQVGCEQCKGPHYTQDFPLKEEGKPLEEAYYTQFGGPFQGGGYRATTPCESEKRREENSNLIKEIRATTDAAIRNQGASIKTLEIQIGQMSKIIITVKKKKKRGSMDQNSQKLMELHISITPYPERRKTQGVSLYLALLIILALIMPFLRERMELDLEARLMGETLVLNRSLDPFLEDYIELNDLNEPFELRRNQGDDLMPTIEEGDVIVGEPFLREVGIKARRIDGIITLYKSDDEVTYQMVRSDLRFKHHTNEQCNKIPSLLKVSEKDEKNGIPYAYQKLKGFYKGVLNLGPDYILNAQAEESAHTRAT
ncbi:hypothetical protein Tco_0653562 [Tanacetum coccineum]|uniref:Uncharacterized protein n=1 Tax=Tanacetum coccineum TaxID=301880 RepID=A0ABQ4X157_9ASTR